MAGGAPPACPPYIFVTELWVGNALNGATLTSHVYGYDGAGRRQTQAETIGGVLKSWTYGYDNLDRLTSANEGANTESYGYDSLGNRKTKTVSRPPVRRTFSNAGAPIFSRL